MGAKLLIEEVKDEDIFIKQNSLTRLITGKKIRKQLKELGIKVEIKKQARYNEITAFLRVPYKQIVFTFHRPPSIDKKVMNDLVEKLSDIIWRRHDCGQKYEYMDTEELGQDV